MKFKLPKKLEFAIYLWFAIIPMFCLILDTILSVTEPAPGPFADRTKDFDISVMSQSIYLSVWVCVLTTIYGTTSLIAFFKHQAMPEWVRKKNYITMVVTITFIQFLVYNLNLIYAKSSGKPTIGFNTWYNILKSVLEHMLTPIFMFAFYYVFPKNYVNDKDFIKKYSWLNFLVVTVYVTFAIVRAALELKYYPGIKTPQEGFNPFPYSELDWTKIGPGLFTLGIVGLFATIWVMGVFFNWTSNLVYNKVSKEVNNVKWNETFKK
ncbi:hypothetical protein SGLAD_v1c07810 [Spiroplasma gladiatoris]|uniref:Uncharacterized protein n=1 Tax=Spiroplasma gladiatoris TaxID=2143 RepID=A0A4P7AK92_9MOLU|nr:hypothetical protein [Spiroplasma gladiatoris]QBQ07980.1 hypothetical protein SGLAD_v1c07810 [Spiroplasma gladiatoris]